MTFSHLWSLAKYWLIIQLRTGFLKDFINDDIVHMVTWVGAVSFEAAVVIIYRSYAVLPSIRRYSGRIASTKYHYQRYLLGGSDMARAGIVTNYKLCISHQFDKFGDIGFTRKVQYWRFRFFYN